MFAKVAIFVAVFYGVAMAASVLFSRAVNWRTYQNPRERLFWDDTISKADVIVLGDSVFDSSFVNSPDDAFANIVQQMTGKRVFNGALNGAEPPDFLSAAQLLVTDGVRGATVVLDVMPNRSLAFRRPEQTNGNYPGRFRRVIGDDVVSRALAKVRQPLTILDPDILLSCLKRTRDFYGVGPLHDRVWHSDGDMARRRFEVFQQQVTFGPFQSLDWIEDVGSILKQNGNSLVVFISPVNNALIDSYSSAADASKYRALLAAAHDRLVEYLRRTSVPYIDATGQLDSDSFADMVHVNKRGNRRFAELIAGYLQSDPDTEVSSASRVVVGHGPDYFDVTAPNSWNPKAAAAYLDQRARWWMDWDGSARDHDTFCISCHTALPYALSRSALRDGHGNPGPSADEGRLLDNVTKRVRLWKEIGPYYNEGDGAYKTSESRGTEAVINALILASRDARIGRLGAESREAFDNMWGEQDKAGAHAGAWPWLQFGLEPWEGGDSQYYGAALAALAVGTAPDNYRSAPDIQRNLALLREYLTHEYVRQSLINRTALLWASTAWPGILETGRRASLVTELLSAQRSDGGWSLGPMARTWKGAPSLRAYVRSWIRKDWTFVDGDSDGYATAFVTFVLVQARVPRNNVQVERGLSWLVRNQDKSSGLWPSRSLNKRRDPSSNTGRFMNDAASAYAVLALTQAQQH